MNVIDVIRSRRTTQSFRPEPVSRQQIQAILDAAVWAPNHRLTQPWRFIVLEGAARWPLADLRRKLKIRDGTKTGLTLEQATAEATENARKVLRAPTIIVVACEQNGNPIDMEEDFAATAAAIQNMLLCATDQGIGTFWTSGPLAAAPETKELLGLHCTDRIVGFVQVGLPAEEQGPSSRQPAVARWVEPREVPRLVERASRLVNHA